MRVPSARKEYILWWHENISFYFKRQYRFGDSFIDTFAKRFFTSEESNCNVNVLEIKISLFWSVYVEVYDI